MGGPKTELEIDSINEFYRRWPSLRAYPATLLEKHDLSAEQRLVLEWMVLVIDRVGPADLHTIRRPDNTPPSEPH